MPKVTFKNQDESAEVEANTELKDVTKDEGWPIAYGCEDGVCGTCLIKVTDGKENLSKLEGQEEMTLDMIGINNGEYRLACQCKVNGDVDFETL